MEALLRRLALPASGRAAFTDGPAHDANIWGEVDVLIVPTLDAPTRWTLQGSAAMPVLISRTKPSPHALTIARPDGSTVCTLERDVQSWAQVESIGGRWELRCGRFGDVEVPFGAEGGV